MSWITAAELQAAAALAEISGTFSNDFCNALIAASEAEFEKLIGYTLVNDTSAERTFRRFDPVRILDLGGFAHTITAIVIDDAYTCVDGDYIFQPENGPYSFIEFYNRVEGKIEVTGKFGYAATCPADVKEAITGYCLAKIKLFTDSAGSSGTGSLIGEKLGELDYKYADTDANVNNVSWVKSWLSTIESYRRVSVG